MRLYLIIISILFGCVKPVYKSVTPDINSPKFKPTLEITPDSLTAIIQTNNKFFGYDSLSFAARKPVSINKLFHLSTPLLHDSTAAMFLPILNKNLSEKMRSRKLDHIKPKNDFVEITFSIDTTLIFSTIRQTINKYNYQINPLFDRKGSPPNFSKIIPTVTLVLPCKGFQVPTRASRIPNAPRSYRSGIHRGIDFFSNWGTPVRSVANGIIVRSDLDYSEVGADFRVEMLKRAAMLDRTPSDIFNELLLGQAVIIDHGFDLFTGFRAITIYAHLSHINSNIKPGYKISAGEIFAKSGNTGTRPSTLGTRDESHLHWELILQDNLGEYYFGQNLDYNPLQISLNKLFNN